MLAQKKFLFSLLIYLPIAAAIFLFLPKNVFAQVVINEFLPNPSSPPDWVELYNTGDEDVDLEGWTLDDEGTSTNMVEIHEATISAHGFLVFDVSNRLNKTEDTVYLRNQNNQEVDSYHYGVDPGTDVSFGRMPDGGMWGTCSPPTKKEINICTVPTPTPTEEPEAEPTPTPTPTPTLVPPTPTPTKKPTPTPSPLPTPTGEILSEATPSAEEVSPTPEVLGQARNPLNLLPKILIGTGALLLLISGAFLLLPKIKGYNLKKDEEIPKIG